MIDLKKLEKLSCLQLGEKSQGFILSLENVIIIMHDLDKIEA